jgi:hypothetical protein
MYDKSPAENNSVALAWAFFEQAEFEELRNFISPTQEGLGKLRSLIMRIVLATDIVDKDLKEQRNARWEAAFGEISLPNAKDDKAAIVLDHLIQASDVCHTMQHWKIYRKWNELLFMECYRAFKEGRSDISPQENWYQGGTWTARFVACCCCYKSITAFGH